jgi:drug/metabolite transporter (DMT)-like permease
LAIAFYRVALAAAIMLPFGAAHLAAAMRTLPRRDLLLTVAAGCALALHFATWIASLDYTSVAASVLLVNTTPLFSAIGAALHLRERPPRSLKMALPLALLGALVIAWGDGLAGGTRPLLGDALAVCGALSLAVHHVLGRGLRTALPLSAYVLAVWTLAALGLWTLARALGTPLGGFPTRTWLVFGALALVPTVAGHGLINRALRVLDAPTVGLFLLGEPLGATLLVWLFMGEVPSPTTALGGLLVLAALAWVVRDGRRP